MNGKSKTVYRIGELANLTRTTPDTLRYYEREGLLAPPRRSEGGFRLYQPAAIGQLAFIRRAQQVGLTIREIRELVSSGASGKGRCRRVRNLLSAKLDEITDQIRELEKCRTALARALRDCDSWLEGPDGTVCPAVDRERSLSPGRRARLRRYQR